MGQAQSQSAGTGCEDCYGSDSHYEYGDVGGGGGSDPNPLRSSSGSRTGAPQQQVSTGGIQQGRTSGSIERGDQPPNGYPIGRITDITSSTGRPQSVGSGQYIELTKVCAFR